MSDGLISSLVNESNHYKIAKEIVEKMLSYKKIISDKLFDNCDMVRINY
jgi:citrate synthase